MARQTGIDEKPFSDSHPIKKRPMRIHFIRLAKSCVVFEEVALLATRLQIIYLFIFLLNLRKLFKR